MRVLVTGGTGFLGGKLCSNLVSKGLHVLAMVRHPEARLQDGIEQWVVPDLPALAHDVAQKLSNVDVIVHAAGRAHVLRDPAADPLTEFRRINTDGTFALARVAASAGVKRFIFISSIGVNGSCSHHSAFRADDKPFPDSPYAQSKWEAEQALNRLQMETGMAVMHLRPPMIYGYGAPGNFALLARLVAKGYPLPLGALRAPKSFVAIDNIVDLLERMVTYPAPPGGVYLVADSEVTTTSHFIRAISKSMGQNLHLIPVPTPLLRFCAGLSGFGEQVKKMAVPLVVDPRDTELCFNWTPPVTMAEAMNRAFPNKKVYSFFGR